MENTLLLGLGRHLIPIPRMIWERVIKAGGRKSGASLGFMSEDHHRVRDFTVLELPRTGAPLAPESIAEALDLPLPRVVSILEELEAHLTFVFRGDQRVVTWAYPVTVDETPHRARFSTGEEAYSPWAIDCFAMPFVQGHLREQSLAIAIETECAHCSRSIEIEIDSELSCHVVAEAKPLVFVPLVNFEKLEDPSIIDAFWRKSVFFWSEEHAREYRRKAGGDRGIYLTVSQAAYITPLTQGPLFAFPRR